MTVLRPLWALVLLLALFYSSLEAASADPHFLKEALSLLDEGAQESCSICAEEKRKEAFQILNEELSSGRLFKVALPHRLVRTELCGENEFQLIGAGLPIPLVFRFDTAEKHLVGISKADCTVERVGQTYSRSPIGSAYGGELIAVPFRYGDGPTYNYLRSLNRLRVHCKILHLEAMDGERDGSPSR